jgi:hypothetical protein
MQAHLAEVVLLLSRSMEQCFSQSDATQPQWTYDAYSDAVVQQQQAVSGDFC